MNADQHRTGGFGRLLGGVHWRHAAGELLLIVAGVLIALAVNGWRDARLERHSEVETLRQIGDALEDDLADSRGDLDRHRGAAAAATLLLASLDRGTLCRDSLGDAYSSLLTVPWHVSDAAPYQSLRSRGLGLIADDSLRIAIVRLYDYRNTVIEVANERGGRFVDDVLAPYVRTHFRVRSEGGADASQPAPVRREPIDCPAVARDPYFRNLVVEALGLRRYAVSRYQPAETEIPTLVAAIDRELRR